MVPFGLVIDLDTAFRYSAAIGRGTPHPTSNRDESEGETDEDTEEEPEDETEEEPETEGIEEGSGGLTGSSNGSAFEGIGVTPDDPFTGDGSDLIDFEFSEPYNLEPLFEGLVDAMIHLLVEHVGDGTLSPGPVMMVPKSFFKDFSDGGGGYDY